MKRTPRRAENAVAKLLSEHFINLNMDPVERFPVIGRRGPDISINQSNLVIDVKSRKEVPMVVISQNDWRHFYEHIQRYRTNNEHPNNGQPQ